MNKQHNPRGIAIPETLLVLIVLAILGFTGWFVWHSKQVTDKTLAAAAKSAQGTGIPSKSTAVKTYDDCKRAAGSKTLLTYPEQCVTKDGKTFTDTSQSSQKYLVIKEWGVAVPMADNVDLNDVYYDLNTTSFSPNQVVWLGSHKVSAVAPSCDPANRHDGSTPFGGIERLTSAEYQKGISDTKNSGVTSGTKLGDFYYAWQARRANCAGVPGQQGYSQANALFMNGDLDNFPVSDMPTILSSIKTY